MIIPFCVHNISDDDCERCELFGYRFNCRGCEQYTNVWKGEEHEERILPCGHGECPTNDKGTQ